MSPAKSSNQSSASTFEKVLDNQIRVATPENISFHYEVTGPFRRLLAYVADIFITISGFTIVTLSIWMLLGLASFILQFTSLGGAFDLLINASSGVLLASGFIMLWFYGAFMETNFNGQTFGKMIVSIRTISVDGSSIDASQAALRNFFRLLDVSPFIPISLMFGPIFEDNASVPIFAFGFICMAISPKYQRVGDLVAGTIVVTEETRWTYGLAKFADSRVTKLAETIDDNFIASPTMARTLAEYVDRRRVLPMSRANEIARHLAVPLVEKLGLKADTNADVLLCALYCKTFINLEQSDSKRREDDVVVNTIDKVKPSLPGEKA